MLYYSTNNKHYLYSLKDAVLTGLAPDGGLFMPEFVPKLPSSVLQRLDWLTFQDISFEIANSFLSPDIHSVTLRTMIEDVLNFDAPLVKFTDKKYALELFHGPTLSFKDFGARFMARLISYFAKGSEKDLIVLVATSGDTGSAVAAGFYNVPGIEAIVLYPSEKVSQVQEKQLTTMGGNITALEIKGTFDDCQRLVKQAFIDRELTAKLQLTSANSINIARLLPQIFYYFYAYRQLKDKNLPVVFSIPSGNFGNLAAGLMAKNMGLPVMQFIAATNANDVVPQYLRTGVFKARPSIRTISNAMDVGNPSNFARILDLYDHDLDKMRKDLRGASSSDKETQKAIQRVYEEYNYILDPHSAVAYLGLKKYLAEIDFNVTGVFFATAHPAKFADVVEKIINEKVPIPEKLKQYLNRKKQSLKMPNDFKYLKSFLLEQYTQHYQK